MLTVDQLIEAMRMRASMGLDPLDRSRDRGRVVGVKPAAAGQGSGSGAAGSGGLGGELGGALVGGDDDLYAIQWAAERVADKVCALACTVPADHLPPRNDAEAEAQESRESELDGLRYGPGSLLYFKIESRRWFTAQIDGEGDQFHVIYSEDFGRAMVIQVAVNGGARVMFCGGAHQVAVAILGIDETGDETVDEGVDVFEGNCADVFEGNCDGDDCDCDCGD